MKKKRKKRKLRKSIRNVFIILLLAALSGIVGFYTQRKQNFINEKVDVVYETVDTKEIYTASMIMMGDALIHDSVYKAYKTSSGYNFDNMLKYIRPISQKYDLAYYNQETILGGSALGLSNYPEFNSPTQVGDAFVKAGFNLVSLATNHTLDRYYGTGGKTVTNSRNYWNKQKDVIAAGSYTSKEQRDEIVIKEVNGIKYCLLSYTMHTNGINVPSGKSYVVNIFSREQAKKDIEKYRDKVDLLIVAMHWGEEYIHYPPQSVKDTAKYLAGLGVDIIVGCHSHVVQPITYIGNTLVVYSLGNAVSSQIGVERLTGLLATVDIKKTVYHGKTTISFSNLEADLIYTNKANKYVIYPYSKLNDNILSGYKNYYKTFSKYVTAYSSKVKMKGV